LKKIIFSVMAIIIMVFVSGCGAQLTPIVNQPKTYKAFDVIVEAKASPDMGLSGFIPVAGTLISSQMVKNTHIILNGKDMGVLAAYGNNSAYYRVESSGKLTIKILGQTKTINVAPNQHVAVFATTSSMEVKIYSQDQIRKEFDFDYSIVK